ncbi:IclR family transcriptional regulator C-terminal domain-containing protein [Streptomyces sp. NPDC056121]|uniref:IclR family transcriptional regulator domain-containing protein n=1 Tax=Streptomyces TaxID=1883 RepID=UPI001D0BBE51|nr:MULTISPECIES: IclR family transcriptional regulator C-terminal domain-containing protein [Streptomyces]MCX5082946.1 helix-turn-helix domain-containing protein [Streptomyces sp. NBC_00401]UDM01068.1 helix-turn-helix domain-containing protein [Streptomyces longhuiensis]
MSTGPVPTLDPGVAAPAEAVAPLMRGIDVLRGLTDAGGTLSLSELARATGLARSTVDRICATLAHMGCLRLDGRDATLAPPLMAVGNAYLGALRLPALLGPRADRLADELDESVSLAVPDGDGIRFIHQATRRRAMSLSFRIGDLLPAERTAPGPLFAGAWDEDQWERWRARRAADPEDRAFPAVPPLQEAEKEPFEERVARAGAAGWALDDQLIEPGLVALAVPVRGPGGDVACVVSVVSHTSRHTAASLREAMLGRLRNAVTEMEKALRRPVPDAPAPTDPDATGPDAAWAAEAKQRLGRDFVESLARGLAVLTVFGPGRAELNLTDIAAATGLARATARRALITLEHLGYVASRGRGFRLTPRVLALGFPPLSHLTLAEIATPHMRALSAQLHDSVSLTVLDGDDIRYTARVATSRVMSVNISVGTRFPAFATSMGRVLLAGLAPAERAAFLARADLAPLTPRTVTGADRLGALLDDVRHRGHALVDGELEEGLRSVAVPVRDLAGQVVAAVNVATHSSRRDLARVTDEVLPALLAASSRIEADLHVAGRFARIPAA